MAKVKLSSARTKFIPISYAEVMKEYLYTPQARAIRLKEVKSKTKKLNKTEQTLLAKLSTALHGVDVIPLGWVSRPLFFGEAFKRLSDIQFRALFSLLAKGEIQFGTVRTSIPVIGHALRLEKRLGVYVPLGYQTSGFFGLWLPGHVVSNDLTFDVEVTI